MAHDRVFDGQIDPSVERKAEFREWLEHEHLAHDMGFDLALKKRVVPSDKWPREHARLQYFRVDLRGI